MGRQEFVSLITFRRTGAPVATPVWIAPDGDALVVTTPVESGKVKRLRRDPRVELRPCSRRGKVADGASMVAAVAEIVPPDNRSTGALREGSTAGSTGSSRPWSGCSRRGRDRVILRIAGEDAVDR